MRASGERCSLFEPATACSIEPVPWLALLMDVWASASASSAAEALAALGANMPTATHDAKIARAELQRQPDPSRPAFPKPVLTLFAPCAHRDPGLYMSRRKRRT